LEVVKRGLVPLPSDPDLVAARRHSVGVKAAVAESDAVMAATEPAFWDSVTTGKGRMFWGTHP
jgi:hypothetical protein